MVEENISQEVKLKNTGETKEYFPEEIDQNRLTSRKHEKVCTTQNYIEFFLHFSFCSYGMYFNFCFCFFAWYSYRNYEFCNRIKIWLQELKIIS